MPNRTPSPLCLELRARVRLGERLGLVRDHLTHPQIQLVVEVLHDDEGDTIWFRYLARLPDWEIRSLHIGRDRTWSYVDRGTINVILNRRDAWVSAYGHVRGEP